MRLSSSYAAFAALLLTVSLAAAHAQTPVTVATVGTQTATSKLGYLVLDFNDPAPNPEVYTFGYNYEPGANDAGLLILLQNTLTGAAGFKETGASSNFVTLLGYNNRSKFNNFAGTNSGDPNGFWNLWFSQNGTTWEGSNFGTSDALFSETPQTRNNPFGGGQQLTSGIWHGWRWVKDFNTDTAQAPRPAFVSAVAPEPGTLVLALFAGASVIVARRRR